MKTYYINGKEINALYGNSDYWKKKYGLEEIVETVNSLLEALSEKKEGKEEICFNCGGSGIHTYEKDLAFENFLENKYGGREEECERCKFDKLPGEYTLPFNYEIKHTCSKGEEEPQLECKHEPERYGSNCKKCHKYMFNPEHGKWFPKEEPKPWDKILTEDVIRKAAEGSNEDQRKAVGLEPKSSLREDCENILIEHHRNNLWTDIATDKIISLFKDTLLKEIRKKYWDNRITGNIITEENLEQVIKNL